MCAKTPRPLMQPIVMSQNAATPFPPVRKHPRGVGSAPQDTFSHPALPFLFVYKASILSGENEGFRLAGGCKHRAKLAASLVIYRCYFLFGLLITPAFPWWRPG